MMSLEILDSPISASDLIERDLSNRQKKIIDWLERIDRKDASKIYKATLFCLMFSDSMPAVEIPLSHCINEFINSLLRRVEDERKSKLKKAIEEMDFSDAKEKDIKDAVSGAFKAIKDKLGDESIKIKKFVDSFTETTIKKDNNIKYYAKDLKGSKDAVQGFRHYKGSLDAKEDIDTIIGAFRKIEDTLFNLSLGHLDKLKNLQKLVEEINSEKEPQKLYKDIEKNLTNENELYFFNNLSNPELIENLKKDIDPTNDRFKISNPWPQGTYLSKIAKQKPKDVFDLIKSYLEDNLSKNQDVNQDILIKIFRISENFPDDKDYSQQIAQFYLDYIKNDQDLDPTANLHQVKDFLRDLKRRGHLDSALEILKELLKLKPIDQDERIKINYFKTRFDLTYNMDDYYYEETIKLAKEILLEDKALDLFKSLCLVMKNVVNSDIDKKICFMRSAIEDHEQDKYKNSTEFKLIDAIRDVSEYIFENNSRDKEKVIEILEEKFDNGSDFLIFTRIALNLLNSYPEGNKQKISSYLTSKKWFNDTNIHHEYYHLMRNNFGRLTEKNKNKVLNFIASGYKERIEGKNPDNYADRWMFDKLDCISRDLKGEWSDKFQSLSKKFQRDKRPDFTHYIESGMVYEESPIYKKDLAKKTLQEIIDFLTSWEPSDVFTISGLTEELLKDFDENPRKYLDDLLLFKDISQPDYLNGILRALAKYHKKTKQDWVNIIDLGEWLLDRDSEPSPDQNNHWGYCKKEFARIIYESCRAKEEFRMPQSLVKRTFSVLEKLILDKDAILENWELTDSNNDKYYNRAINSCHGESIAAAIECCLWLFRENRKDNSKNLLTPLLDKIIDNPRYLEGMAVLGRYLPWIILISEDWVKKNLNNILPEKDKKDNFNAVWWSYINLTPPFDQVFEILKDKYVFASRNPKYVKMDDDGDNSKFGERVAAFYSRGKINLNDALIKNLNVFDPKSISAIISIIGKWLCNKNETFKDGILDKFKSLWDWKAKNNPLKSDHKSFKWWYKSTLFDRKWALKEFLKSCEELGRDRKPDLLNVEEVILEDLQKYPEISWNLVKLILKTEGYFTTHDFNFIKRIFDLIEDSQWYKIKAEAVFEKDNFCRKFRLNADFKPV